MAGRCNVRATREDGTTTHALSCCRLAGHAGECHFHFSGLMTRQPHATLHRGTGYLLECGEGAARDGGA